MSAPPRKRLAIARLPEVDRRAGHGERGLAAWWRRLKGTLKRPLRIERRGLQWHVELVDRRRSGEPFKPGSEVRLVAELRARLLAIEHHHAAAAMRQLVRVHDELRRSGWRGVEHMSARDLGRALVQAELLASLEASRSMSLLVDKLRIFKTGAELRQERRAAHRAESYEGNVDVSETSFEDFHVTERARRDAGPPPVTDASGAATGTEAPAATTSSS